MEKSTETLSEEEKENRPIENSKEIGKFWKCNTADAALNKYANSERKESTTPMTSL